MAVELDPYTAEILRSAFNSTAREQQITCTNCSFSFVFALGEDFSSALLDSEGRMVAQANAVPVHLGAIPVVMEHVLEKFDSIGEGDVVMHNAPYSGGTHHSDVSIIKPIYHGGEMVAMGINRGHWVDIGGMSAAGFAGDATDVIQEGLVIPAVKLYKGGVLDQDLRDFLLSNVRLGREVWGDLQGQLAGCITAERRIHALIERYGRDVVVEGMRHTMEYTRKRFRDRIDEVIPDGEYEGEDFMDDDGNSDRPYRIRVRVEKEAGERLLVDFTGSDEQAGGPINASYAITLAATVTAFIMLLDPRAPINQGVYDNVEIIAPEGTVVNPTYPAPLYGGNCDTAARITDAVLRALTPAAPERAMGGNYGTGHNMTLTGTDYRTGMPYILYIFYEGGWGGRATKDGIGNTLHLQGNCLNPPVEAFEHRYPVVFEKVELVADSGGPGRFRGGLGHVRHMRVIGDARWSAYGDRSKSWNAAYGVFGGKPGMPNAFYLIRDGVRYTTGELFGTVTDSKFSNLKLRDGDIIVCLQGGGGGYGDPRERDPEMVRWDLKNGYVSARSAREDYAYAGEA